MRRLRIGVEVELGGPGGVAHALVVAAHDEDVPEVVPELLPVHRIPQSQIRQWAHGENGDLFGSRLAQGMDGGHRVLRLDEALHRITVVGEAVPEAIASVEVFLFVIAGGD